VSLFCRIKEKFIKTITFSVALILTIICVTSVAAQSVYTTKSGYFAAINEEALDKCLQYIVDKDREALGKLYDSGLIFPLKEGLRVYYVKSSYSGVKIRPEGELIEIWTVREALSGFR